MGEVVLMRFQAILILTLASSLLGQEPNPVQEPGSAEQTPTSRSPIYRVNVIARTTKAVNYRDRQRPTKIDFAGTVLLPESEGEARVQSKKGATQIQAEFEGMEPPDKFGRQYLTYVLWAVTPDGRASNLGQIVANGKNKAKLEVTTELPDPVSAVSTVVEGHIDITGMPEAVVLAGAEHLTLRLEDGRTLPFTLGSTLGRITIPGGLPPASRTSLR